VLSVATGAQGKYLLNKGSMLFAPKHDLTVHTSAGIVSIRAGAVALVVSAGHSLAVYDMHDAHHGDVVVSGADGPVSLSVGRHVMFSKKNANSFDDINALSPVTHRSVNSNKLGSGAQQFSSEFSITSALNGLRVFAHLKQSNNPSDAKLVRQLMKNAAIILQTTRTAAPYVRAAKQAPVLMVRTEINHSA